MKQNWMIVTSVLMAFTLGVVGMWAFQNRTSLSTSWFSNGVTAPAQVSVVPPATSSLSAGQQMPGQNISPSVPFSSDPFAQLELMQQRMDKMFGLGGPQDLFGRNGPSVFGSPFDSNSGLSGAGSLTVSEDDNSVTYHLDVPKKDLADLKVNVKDGYLSVDATVKQESQGSIFQSQISQMLPLPADADPNSLKVESGVKSVVIHLDKQRV